MINFGVKRVYVFRSNFCPNDETFADVVPANQKPIMITELTYYGAFAKLKQEGILLLVRPDSFVQTSTPYSKEDRFAVLDEKTILNENICSGVSLEKNRSFSSRFNRC